MMTSNKQIVTDVANTLAHRPKCTLARFDKAESPCSNLAVASVGFVGHQQVPKCQECIDTYCYYGAEYYDEPNN